MGLSKVLFITEDFIKGGVAQVAQNLANEINLHDEYHLDLLILNPRNDYQLANLLPPLNPAPAGPSKLAKSWRLFTDTWKLKKVVAGYDIILVNGDLFQVTIPLWFLSFVLHLRVIGWIHACLNQVRYYPNQIIKYLHCLSLVRMDKIVCVSSQAVNGLQTYLGRHKLKIAPKVIYNPFVITDALARSNLLPQCKFKLIALGRLYPEKNFAMIIQALAQLNNPDIGLVICGDGAEYTNLVTMIDQYALGDQVYMAGQVDDPLSYVQVCDLLISSSNTEALPTVILEALACSKLVIATQTGACEILEHSLPGQLPPLVAPEFKVVDYGIVIPVSATASLVSAINYLINHPELQQQLRNRVNRALTKFDVTAIGKLWQSEFNLLCTTLSK